MEERAIDRAVEALEMLESLTMIHEAGRTDIIEEMAPYDLDRGEEWGVAFEGLAAVGDYMQEKDDKDGDTGSMYFSSNDMMEYYRLCRDYCKAKGCSLKENPYMQKAARFVSSEMNAPDCYYVDFSLQTKLNHKWASGIAFRYDKNYFYEYLALLTRLVNVFGFYTETLVELRAELQTLKKHTVGEVVAFPTKTTKKRRAA